MSYVQNPACIYYTFVYVYTHIYNDPVLLKIEWAILATYNILCLEKILERKHVALDVKQLYRKD